MKASSPRIQDYSESDHSQSQKFALKVLWTDVPQILNYPDPEFLRFRDNRGDLMRKLETDGKVGR